MDPFQTKFHVFWWFLMIFDDFWKPKRCATSVRSFWRRYRAEISTMCQKTKVFVLGKNLGPGTGGLTTSPMDQGPRKKQRTKSWSPYGSNPGPKMSQKYGDQLFVHIRDFGMGGPLIQKTRRFWILFGFLVLPWPFWGSGEVLKLHFLNLAFPGRFWGLGGV